MLVDGDDLPERAADAVGGKAIRLGIDAVAGTATDRIAQCLGPGATLVNYGAISRQACALPPQSFIFNDITLRGFWLARWFQNASPEKQMAIFGELLPMIVDGRLHASIHATYPVDRIQEAVAAAAGGKRNGKVLIVPGEATA